jgi:hypothetical protein
MTTGTARAVLVYELLFGDGPHLAVADAFVSQVCMACNLVVEDKAQLSAAGFYCGPCSALAA